jgi:hypothetical protein
MDVVSGVAAISNCPAMLVKYAVWFACRFAFVSRVEALSVWVGWRFDVVSAGEAI